MADNNGWIKEVETGRWYISQTGEDGGEIRRYQEELDQETQQDAYEGYEDYQEGYHEEPPQSIEEVYEERVRVNPGDQPSSSHRRSPEIPRSHPTSRGSRRQRRPSTVQNESSGRRRKYNDPGGSNQPSQRGHRRNEPSHRDAQAQASSSRDVASSGFEEPPYEDPSVSSVTNTLARRLDINECASGPNYEFARSPPHQMGGQGPMMVPAQGRYAPSRRYIAPTEGHTEPLDRSYRMRNKDWQTFFSCGRVFKTLWTDPAGPQNESDYNQFMSKATKAGMYRVAHGEWVYSKIRRFIVVSRNGMACQCLPVTTYDGRGYRKRGINLEQHGLIYTGNAEPGPVPGIVNEPLRIKEAVEELVISYINYGRSYCVDTNVKVKDVGVLDGPSRSLLRQYYRAAHFDEYESPMPVPEESSQMRASAFTQIGGQFEPPRHYSPAPAQYLPPGTQYEEEYIEELPVAALPLPNAQEPVREYDDAEYQAREEDNDAQYQARDDDDGQYQAREDDDGQYQAVEHADQSTITDQVEDQRFATGEDINLTEAQRARRSRRRDRPPGGGEKERRHRRHGHTGH